MDGLPVLRGEGVILRPWRAEDASVLHREIQDPDTVRWLDIRLPYTIEDARTFIASCADQWETRKGAQFAVTDPDDGFVGYIGVLAVEEGMRVVEIVYWVAASARGAGTAGRALRTAIPWVEASVGPDRIELGMLEGNTASARTAESAGFVLREVQEVTKAEGGPPVRELIYQLEPNQDGA
jgi:RimJ/RimL family protein N-acetyltransferase